MVKGVRIEGLISRKVIKMWLDNWDSVQAGDRPYDAIPVSTGYKNKDGVSDSAINRLMLEAAIRDLPPVLYICVKYRWLEQLPIWKILKATGIPRSTYYRRCDKAIDFIYYHVNGSAAGMKDLLDQIADI